MTPQWVTATLIAQKPNAKRILVTNTTKRWLQ